MAWVRKADLRSYVPGPQGPRGLPGVNAVENDEAVAACVEATDSDRRAALGAVFARKRALDPRDFGAVGDGTTDDQAALQACLNAAGSGGAVELPPLTFKLASAIVIPDGVELRGSGARGSTLFADTDITMVRTSGGQAQTLRNLRVRNWFVGTRTTYDIDITNPTKPVLSDVEVDLATGTLAKGGIRFRKDSALPGNAFMPQLSRVWVRNGHLVIDGVTDGHFVDGYVWGVNTGARAAVDMFNIANGWSFQGVDVIPTEGSGAGFRLEQVWDTNINGGYVDGSYTEQDTGYGVLVINGGQLFMSATRFYHLGRSGIRLEGTSGCSITAVGFARNNKQDNYWPDIDLYNASYNTFVGMAHSQRAVRSKKGPVYREDSASVGNSYDQSAVDITAGNNYGTPWFAGNDGTLGTRNRPGALWPRPTSVPNTIVPDGCLLGEPAPMAWPAANRAQFHRFHLTAGGVYQFASFRCNTAGGNVQAAVVRMDGMNYTRVMASPVTVTVTGHMQLDMGATYLAPGEYALVLWADGTTFQTSQLNSEMVRSTRMCGEATSLTGGIPSSGSLSAWSTTRAVIGLSLLAAVYPSTHWTKLQTWKARLANQRAANGPSAMVLAGSSTTAANPGYATPLTPMLQDRLYPVAAASALQRSSSASFTANTGAGLHVYNAGEGGTTSATYLTNAEMDNIAALSPALILHMVGANDYTGQVNPATVKSNLEAKLSYLDSKMSQPCQHLLVHSYAHRTFNPPTYAHALYGEAMREIAEARTNVAFLDLSGVFAARGVPGADPDGLIGPDDTHLTPAGYAFMTDLLFEHLIK